MLTKTFNLAAVLAMVLIMGPATWGQALSKFDSNQDILFHCSFDGTLEPAIQKGEKGFDGTASPEFTEGLKGGKALVTSNTQNATYPIEGNLNLTQGTIKFWVMPMDWSGNENLFHHFLRVLESGDGQDTQARQFSLILYRFIDWRSVVAFGMAGELTGSNLLQIPMADTWVPKQWHQIVFTWDKEGASLYVDGEGRTQRYLQGPPDTLAAKRFIVGGPYFIENKTQTAIDELYILNRKLSVEEVKQAFKTELVEGLMH